MHAVRLQPHTVHLRLQEQRRAESPWMATLHISDMGREILAGLCGKPGCQVITSVLSISTCLEPTCPSSSGSVGCSTTDGGKGSVQMVGLWKVVVKL